MSTSITTRLADGELVKLGNTVIQALATPGHAVAHHAYLVTDHRRGDEPWMVLTGDALLVGDAGRPDLHAHGEQTVEEMARTLYRSLTERLLALPDDLLLYPAHYSGSVCGRGLSGHPASTIGFERRHNDALGYDSEDAFVAALIADIPPAPEQQAEIVAANRAGRRARASRLTAGAVRLGLRENAAQFSLLVAVNALVGAMVGLERSTLPLIGETEFGLSSSAAVLSFIVAFGLAKSLTNLGAGAWRERVGRRRLLILGWAVALPVPLLIALAPTWGWIVAANVFLGINQGLAWSMTVVMKIDLVGPERRGFALGLNEAAGYGGVALAAAVSGWLAAEFVARDVLVVGGAGDRRSIAADLTLAFVRDTGAHVALEQPRHHADAGRGAADLARRVPGRHLPRPGASRLLSGRPRQQPQRRARLGARAALSRRRGRERRARSGWSPASTRPSGGSGRSGRGIGPTASDASR